MASLILLASRTQEGGGERSRTARFEVAPVRAEVARVPVLGVQGSEVVTAHV